MRSHCSCVVKGGVTWESLSIATFFDLGSDSKPFMLMVKSTGFGVKPITAVGFGTNYLAFLRFSFLVGK